MKKLQILTIALLATASINASNCGRGPADETFDQKIARQRARTQEQKDNYLESKECKVGFRHQTPAVRLLIKAIEYRANLEGNAITQEQFNDIMANKEATYRHNLKQNNIAFGAEQAALLDFCKTAPASQLALKLEAIKAAGQEFMD